MNLYSDGKNLYYDEKSELSDENILQDSRLIEEMDPNSLQDHRLLVEGESHPLDTEGRLLLDRSALMEVPRNFQDPRLLDAAETLVNLRGTDLASSNNPLFGGVASSAPSSGSTTLTLLQNSDAFARDDKSQFQLITEMTTIPPNLMQIDNSSGLHQDDPSSNPMILTSVSPGSILVTQNDIQTSASTTPSSSTGRGRGRGRGTGKRGRGKKDAGGVGRGGAVGTTAGASDGASIPGGANPGNMEEDGGMEGAGGEAVAAEKPPEMLRVGSLFIKSSIFDDILTERKVELFNHPSVQQFLKKNRICS